MPSSICRGATRYCRWCNLPWLRRFRRPKSESPNRRFSLLPRASWRRAEPVVREGKVCERKASNAHHGIALHRRENVPGAAARGKRSSSPFLNYRARQAKLHDVTDKCGATPTSARVSAAADLVFLSPQRARSSSFTGNPDPRPPTALAFPYCKRFALHVERLRGHAPLVSRNQAATCFGLRVTGEFQRQLQQRRQGTCSRRNIKDVRESRGGRDASLDD